MTPEDAARIVDLPLERLLALAADGEIPGAMLNRAGWRFSRDGLEKFLKRRAKALPRQDDAA